MKIRIILEGTGGEVDRQTIEVHEASSADLVSDSILHAIVAWTLAPGDVIRIVEVES